MKFKRLLLCFLSFFLLVGCTAGGDRPTPNTFLSFLQNDGERFLAAVQELEGMKKDRFYVALEEKKKDEKEEKETEEEPEIILVTYVTKSGDHEELQSDLLFSLLQDYGFRLLYFQTARDSRRCVLFSLQEEGESFVQGMYYSFDSQPCGWWGRQADLKKKGNRFLQLNENGSAGYFTLPLQDGFYYFEKHGNLVA